MGKGAQGRMIDAWSSTTQFSSCNTIPGLGNCSETTAVTHEMEEESISRADSHNEEGDDEEFQAKKRQMNIIYSRRKRLKKKMQTESLQASSLKLQRENMILRNETARLQRLVATAQIIVTEIEGQNRGAALFSMHQSAIAAQQQQQRAAPIQPNCFTGIPPHMSALSSSLLHGVPSAMPSNALRNHIHGINLANQSPAETSSRGLQSTLLALGAAGSSFAHRDLLGDGSSTQSALLQDRQWHEQRRQALIEYALQRERESRMTREILGRFWDGTQRTATAGSSVVGIFATPAEPSPSSFSTSNSGGQLPAPFSRPDASFQQQQRTQHDALVSRLLAAAAPAGALPTNNDLQSQNYGTIPKPDDRRTGRR
jgi:hypothetical protein